MEGDFYHVAPGGINASSCLLGLSPVHACSSCNICDRQNYSRPEYMYPWDRRGWVIPSGDGISSPNWGLGAWLIDNQGEPSGST